MSFTILDALSPDPLGGALAEAVARLGAVRAVHPLRDERFAPCAGCFECWIAHPGSCKARDDANGVMADVIASEEVVWGVEPRYGCWSPESKVALDKTLGLLSPFFTTVDGETHHVSRYPRYPRLGVVAVEDPRGSAADRDLLRLLVARNALNFQTDRSWVAFVRPEASPAEVLAEIYAARAAATADVPRVSPFARPDRIGVPAHPDRPRRALLVVGSSKPPGESVSERLGGALLDRLAARGWERDTVHVQRAVKLHRGTAPELVEAAQGADLIVLASPVYVDSLPAPVLAGLRHLEEAEWPGPRPALLPLVQCGFPELTHTALALEVLSRFADRAGFGWAGQLAAGGGGTFDGARLDHPNGRAGHQVRALDAAAAELDAGDPVSPGTSATFAVTPLSPAVYRLVADVGWVAQAWRNGALWQLGARPFPLE